jgi:hypothetical protein
MQPVSLLITECPRSAPLSEQRLLEEQKDSLSTIVLCSDRQNPEITLINRNVAAELQNEKVGRFEICHICPSRRGKHPEKDGIS